MAASEPICRKLKFARQLFVKNSYAEIDEDKKK
jgi:hypothetical protein